MLPEAGAATKELFIFVGLRGGGSSPFKGHIIDSAAVVRNNGKILLASIFVSDAG
jgi:hypothetical protein